MSFLLLNPPLWGLDEPAHFARAYQISEGQVRPNISRENYGGDMPENFFAISWYRGADIQDGKYSSGESVLQRQDVTYKHAYDKILNEHFSKSERNFHWTALYSPITYPGPVLGISIARVLNLTIGQTFFIARLFSLLIYVAICFFALWMLRHTRLGWLFMVAALLPTALFQAGAVTSDNILLALSILFFSLYARLLVIKNPNPVQKRVLISLCAIGALMPLIKINYVFLSLSLLALPVVYFKSTHWSIAYKAGVALSSIFPALLWSQLSGATDAPAESQRADHLAVNPSDQIYFVIQYPLDFLVAIIKSLIIYGDDTIYGIFFSISGIGVDVPIILMFFLMAMLFVTALYAKKDLIKMKRQIIYLLLLSLITSVSIYGALYAVFNPVGWWFIDGVQGRYFTPFVLPITMFAALFLPLTLSPISRRTVKISAVSVATGCLLVCVIYDFLAFY